MIDNKQKQAALEQIALEVNNGWIDDETCARRLAEIGANEDELAKVMGI